MRIIGRAAVTKGFSASLRPEYGVAMVKVFRVMLFLAIPACATPRAVSLRVTVYCVKDDKTSPERPERAMSDADPRLEKDYE